MTYINMDLIIDGFDKLADVIATVLTDKGLLRANYTLEILNRAKAQERFLHIADMYYNTPYQTEYAKFHISEIAEMVHTATTLGLDRDEIICQLRHLADSIAEYQEIVNLQVP